MLRTSSAQKQYELPNRSKIMSGFSIDQSSLEPSSIIKTMMKIIRIESKDKMDVETRAQFSKITDAIVRMTDEIKE